MEAEHLKSRSSNVVLHAIGYPCNKIRSLGGAHQYKTITLLSVGELVIQGLCQLSEADKPAQIFRDLSSV